MPRVLTHEQARRAYDRIGARQDTQAFYEDAATTLVAELGEFESATSIFEFGCGTGRFAERLFATRLSATARYRGIDLSPEMVRLAQRRLAKFADRAEVLPSDGAAPTDEPAGAYDRFVSNYVFDLLAEADMRAVVDAAHRMLAPHGLICLSSLGTGSTPASRVVARSLARVQSRWPALIGGCRPIDLRALFEETHWTVLHHRRITRFAIPSDVLVARSHRGVGYVSDPSSNR